MRQGETGEAGRSEAEELKRRIEELRARLYARPGVAYEDAPELHDDLDRLIVRYVRLVAARPKWAEGEPPA